MPRLTALAEWLNQRTGCRAVLSALMPESTPGRPHWAYTLGAALLALLVVQAASGIILMLYYVPTPTHAYDSVRYIVSEVPFGWLIRGLHYYGASFIVALAVLHLLRTLVFGAYKAPREITWLSGFVLLTLLIAFGLTGYLLPWDQLGYWSTVVRANIAGTTPVIGHWMAALMRGGPWVGALTLSRWYTLHVVVLPTVVIGFCALHIYLVRLHGRAGHYAGLRPTAPAAAGSQRLRGALASTAALGALVATAIALRAPLEVMADPGDFSFIPHPEWYFLWLFQLMKLTQGPLEFIGAPVVLTFVMAFLVLLPFLDRQRERHPARRAWVMGVATLGLAGISALTWMALRHLPPDGSPDAWSPVAIAGQDIAARPQCQKCHAPDKPAPNLSRGRITHDSAWIRNHLSDPDAMAPGMRATPFDAPTKSETVAVLAYTRKVRAGARPPLTTASDRAVSLQYTTACASCHMMDGDGISDGPDLTFAGRERDVAWIAEKIVDPTKSDPEARMPSLKDKMSPEEVRQMADFLARRK